MAKRNKRYWQERAAEHRKIIDKDAEQIIRETQAAYERSLHHIDGEIARWYQRFADAEEITMEEARQRMNAGELNQFRMTLEEYIARGEQLDLDPSWADALEKASALHHIDRYDAMRTIIRAEMEELKAKTRGAGWMDKIAEDAYLHMIYSMSREMQMAIGFNQPAIERLKQLVKEPWAPDGVDFVKRADINMDKLAAEITKKLQQACITGQPYRELAADIEKTVGLKAYEAERIIRTESTQIASNAEKAAYNTAGIEQYEVLVTLDDRTCELCGMMDGYVEDVDKMEAGVNAPPFHPNCRCTTVGHYDDGVETTRIAKDENGRNIYVDGNMTWAEWNAMYGRGDAPGQNAETEPEKKDDSSEEKKKSTDLKEQANIDAALEYYVSGDGMYINKYLRDPEGFTEAYGWNESDQAILDDMRKGTRDTIKEKQLYRSVDASSVFGPLPGSMLDDITDYIKYGETAIPKRIKSTVEKAADVVGKTITEKGFMSTTKDRETALYWGDYTGSDHPIMLELDLPPNGARGADLKRFDVEGDEQYEVLLAPDQTYTVTGMYVDEGTLVVKAKIKR